MVWCWHPPKHCHLGTVDRLKLRARRGRARAHRRAKTASSFSLPQGKNLGDPWVDLGKQYAVPQTTHLFSFSLRPRKALQQPAALCSPPNNGRLKKTKNQRGVASRHSCPLRDVFGEFHRSPRWLRVRSWSRVRISVHVLSPTGLPLQKVAVPKKCMPGWQVVFRKKLNLGNSMSHPKGGFVFHPFTRPHRLGHPYLILEAKESWAPISHVTPGWHRVWPRLAA